MTNAESVVIVMKQVAGSAWREAGRTGLCPTPEWLHQSFGEGQFELHLKRGNRIVCFTAAVSRPSGSEQLAS